MFSSVRREKSLPAEDCCTRARKGAGSVDGSASRAMM